MAQQHVNLPEFARRARIPYPTFHRSWRDDRLPPPTVKPEDNGGSALWSAEIADEWIIEQGIEPLVDDTEPKPMPTRAKASTFDIIDEEPTGKAGTKRPTGKAASNDE